MRLRSVSLGLATTLSVAFTVAGACSGGDDSSDTTTGFSGSGGSFSSTSASGGSTSSASSSSSGSSTGASTDSDSAGSTATGPKFDAAVTSSGGSTGGPDTTAIQGCGNVDLLFVVDDSGSMSDNQANLINNFPKFADAMQNQLTGVKSFHVGVVTSDQYSGNQPGCTGLGDLVTQTAGTDSSSQNCAPFAEGHRYMTEMDDLADKFVCAARVGADGNGDEKQMGGMLGALHPTNNAAGACNEGFLRDDALLVVVVLTDEDDYGEECIPIFGCMPSGSDGNPPDWYNTIVSLKNGIETNIVVLSLVAQNNTSCADATGDRIIEFTNMFTYGFVGEVCAPSYENFFLDAVGNIGQACENFIPPG